MSINNNTNNNKEISKDSPSYNYFNLSVYNRLLSKATEDFSTDDLHSVIINRGYQYLGYRELNFTRELLDDLYNLSTWGLKQDINKGNKGFVEVDVKMELLLGGVYHIEYKGKSGVMHHYDYNTLTELTAHLENKEVYIDFYQKYLKARAERLMNYPFIKNPFFNNKESYCDFYNRVYEDDFGYAYITKSIYGIDTLVWLVGEVEAKRLVCYYYDELKRVLLRLGKGKWSINPTEVEEVTQSEKERILKVSAGDKLREQLNIITNKEYCKDPNIPKKKLIIKEESLYGKVRR